MTSTNVTVTPTGLPPLFGHPSDPYRLYTVEHLSWDQVPTDRPALTWRLGWSVTIIRNVPNVGGNWTLAVSRLAEGPDGVLGFDLHALNGVQFVTEDDAREAAWDAGLAGLVVHERRAAAEGFPSDDRSAHKDLVAAIANAICLVDSGLVIREGEPFQVKVDPYRAAAGILAMLRARATVDVMFGSVPLDLDAVARDLRAYRSEARAIGADEANGDPVSDNRWAEHDRAGREFVDHTAELLEALENVLGRPHSVKK